MKHLLCLTSLVCIVANVSAITLAPGDVIDREADWTGTAGTEDNWSYSYYHDTSSDPSKGWQEEGVSMVWKSSEFRASSVGSTWPRITNSGIFMNSNTVSGGYNNDTHRWWSIISWTSEQNGLLLQAIGRLFMVDGFDDTHDLGQIVLGIERASGVFESILNVTIDPPKAASFFADSDFSTNQIMMNSGDRLFIAGRSATDNLTIRPNPNTYLGFYDRDLTFEVLQNPGPHAVPDRGVTWITLVFSLSALGFFKRSIKRL